MRAGFSARWPRRGGPGRLTRLRLLAGACAAALLDVGMSHRLEHGGDAAASRVTMLSWNVLARNYTTYNAHFHCAAGPVEEPTQTRDRYTIAGEEIVRRFADFVFLQECEPGFFSPEWNLAATKLLEAYDVYPCLQDSSRRPFTSILVKRGGAVEVLEQTPLLVGGTVATGGMSKTATVVRVQVGGRRFAVASVHFAWDGNARARLRHAELLGDALGEESAIIAGDFNCQPGRLLEALEGATFFRRLRRIALPPGSMTGLTGDFSKEVYIDHVYISPELGDAKALALGKPASPWGDKASGPANVTGASDHVPISVELDLMLEPMEG